MDKTTLLLCLAGALFTIGLAGVVIRRNALVMLMCMELMLNGVNLSLVTFAQERGDMAPAILVFLVFVVATAEVALAIPIVLLLVKHRRSLDLGDYDVLKG
ncbi:MAG: NADH-quinone oxidoreductase subunit NuoK [Gemmatimonadaceae bacterium]|jgi:NADH-quinone oxidoreductase subunit K